MSGERKVLGAAQWVGAVERGAEGSLCSYMVVIILHSGLDTERLGQLWGIVSFWLTRAGQYQPGISALIRPA